MTYEKLAKKCGISRGSLYKYFPDISSLLLFLSGMIRVNLQGMVIEKMRLATSPIEMLKLYALTSLDWTDTCPKHAVIWILFYHKCCVDEELANFNRNLVDVGTQRIAGILRLGHEKGHFKLDPERIPGLARNIQLLITGTLVSRPTENRNPQSWQDEKNLVMTTIFELVGTSSVL